MGNISPCSLCSQSAYGTHFSWKHRYRIIAALKAMHIADGMMVPPDVLICPSWLSLKLQKVKGNWNDSCAMNESVGCTLMELGRGWAWSLSLVYQPGISEWLAVGLGSSGNTFSSEVSFSSAAFHAEGGFCLQTGREEVKQFQLPFFIFTESQNH